MKTKILFLIIAFALSSCEFFKPEKNDALSETTQLNAEEMYKDALDRLQRGSYSSSIEQFERLERTYPYSKLAIKAQIMSAYSSFKNEEYDTALVSLDRFIKLNPGNENVPYAYYLIALSHYNQISNIAKDQGNSLLAKSALEEVILRFPNSEYAKDSKFKLDLVIDNLAGKEVDVGRFYLSQGNTIGAINRFQQVVKKYDTTSHVPEALHRLVEAYSLLGVDSEAIKYASVLGYNYPDSEWYQRTYKLLVKKDISIDASLNDKS